jgi:hypothetical protein
MSAPPRSLDPIRHRLARRRTSIQPSERAHQGFYKEMSNPYNEAGIAAVMMFEIMGDCGRDDRNYGRHLRRAITEIRTLPSLPWSATERWPKCTDNILRDSITRT